MLKDCTDSSFLRIGESAKHAFHSNPHNTVFDAKRLIGRRVDDPDVQKDMKHWPFKVQEKNGKPVISVQYDGETRDFVRFILARLRLLTLIRTSSIPKKSALWYFPG